MAARKVIEGGIGLDFETMEGRNFSSSSSFFFFFFFLVGVCLSEWDRGKELLL